MMLTPAAKPLFSQAILSSGGIMAVRTPETARILSRRYLDILGLADIKDILSCPVDKILAAQLEFAKSAGSTCLFGPVADGELIPLNWKEDIRSENGWIGNTLIGNNLHELMFFAFNPHLLEAAPGIAAELFGDRGKDTPKPTFAELSKDAADDKAKGRLLGQGLFRLYVPFSWGQPRADSRGSAAERSGPIPSTTRPLTTRRTP